MSDACTGTIRNCIDQLQALAKIASKGRDLRIAGRHGARTLPLKAKNGEALDDYGDRVEHEAERRSAAIESYLSTLLPSSTSEMTAVLLIAFRKLTTRELELNSDERAEVERSISNVIRSMETLWPETKDILQAYRDERLRSWDDQLSELPDLAARYVATAGARCRFTN